MRHNTRVIIISTGEIGYVERQTRSKQILVRIPELNEWPFPRYKFVPIGDIKLAGDQGKQPFD